MDNIIWLVIGAVLVLLGVGGAVATRKKKDHGSGMTPEQFQEKVRKRENELKEKPAGDIVAGLDNSADVESVKRESGNRIRDRFSGIFNRRKREKRGPVDR